MPLGTQMFVSEYLLTKGRVSRRYRVINESTRADGPISRKDLLNLVPPEYVEYMASRVGPGDAAVRAGAGRLLWSLARRGDIVVARKVGSQQMYAARAHWFPRLKWPKKLGAGSQARAAATLARRYLQAYGPATAADMGHFFGAKISTARTWLEAIQNKHGLVQVSCGERKGLVALTADLDKLEVSPPGGLKGWPVRLLPTWDCLLMGHADKSWTVPNELERKAVWRKAAMVSAVVLARGRVVAIWTQKKRRRELLVTVEPLNLWRGSKHLPSVKREARAVARHLGLEGAEVRLTA